MGAPPEPPTDRGRDEQALTLLFFEVSRACFATPALDVLRALPAGSASGQALPTTLVELGAELPSRRSAADSERRILVLRGEQDHSVLVDCVLDVRPVALRHLSRLPPWFPPGSIHPWVWGALCCAEAPPTLVLNLLRHAEGGVKNLHAMLSMTMAGAGDPLEARR